MDIFARVELHEDRPGDKPDYDVLHGYMREIGFRRFVFEGMAKKRFRPVPTPPQLRAIWPTF